MSQIVRIFLNLTLEKKQQRKKKNKTVENPSFSSLIQSTESVKIVDNSAFSIKEIEGRLCCLWKLTLCDIIQ